MVIANSRTMRTLLLMFTLLSAVALAKPMPAASVDQGVAESALIVVAEYAGYRGQTADYFKGPVAQYKILETIKGKSPKRLSVTYDFTDGSACIMPKAWKFGPDKMPKVGSKWILLVSKADEPATTYRGSSGRIRFSESELARVRSLLK